MGRGEVKSLKPHCGRFKDVTTAEYNYANENTNDDQLVSVNEALFTQDWIYIKTLGKQKYLGHFHSISKYIYLSTILKHFLWTCILLENFFCWELVDHCGVWVPLSHFPATYYNAYVLCLREFVLIKQQFPSFFNGLTLKQLPLQSKLFTKHIQTFPKSLQITSMGVSDVAMTMGSCLWVTAVIIEITEMPLAILACCSKCMLWLA